MIARFVARFAGVVAVLGLTGLPASAQVFEKMDETWTVTVNGQSVRVETDGSFTIPNVSAPDQFGAAGPGTAPDFVSDDFLRVIGISTTGGQTRYAYSDHFRFRRGQQFSVGMMTISDSPLPLPQSIRIEAGGLVPVGQSLPLTVWGRLINNNEINVTSAGTTYRTSNQGIATVDGVGIVTATSPGFVLITAGNEGSTAVHGIQVTAAIRRTTVTGLVMQQDGNPFVGAAVATTFGGMGVSGPGGFFRFDDLSVPSEAQTLTATATATIGGDLFRASNTVELMAPGVTDVGFLVLRQVDAVFETEYGTNQDMPDDDFTTVPLGFAFPFYGIVRTVAFLGSNGYLTFDSGDGGYNESIDAHVSPLPRISLFFDDLYPGIPSFDRNVYVNHMQSPNRLVVTWDRVPEFPNTGSNTLQVVLFENGRIQFGYAGMTATDGIVGLSPGGSPPFVQVDFSTLEAGLGIAPGTAVLEQFLFNFDLDGGFVVFEPSGTGYDVSFVPPPPLGMALGVVHGRVIDIHRRAVAGCLVQLDCPSDPSFVRCARTDESGKYRIDGVPLGASIRARAVQNPKLVGAGVVEGNTRIDLSPMLEKADH